MLLEVIVTSADDAAAAARAGADRLELVSAPGRGGLTPSVEVLRSVLDVVDVPVRAMLRERDDDVQHPDAWDRFASLAADLVAAGVAGLVTGGLTRDDVPHVDGVVRALSSVPGVPWTFHRALDATPRFVDACRTVLDLPGCDTVLVAGRPAGVDAGLRRLRELFASDVAPAAVLVGGGVRARHVPLLRQLGVRAVHLGRAVRTGATWDGPVDADRVRDLRDLLA